MAAEDSVYLPFKGFSAWFSCSVNPSTIKLWEHNGGVLSGENEAFYLFSDDAFTKDTTRLYSWQKDIVVIQTSWIKEILHKKCPARSVALSRHLLTPHFMIGLDLIRKEEQTTKSAAGCEKHSTSSLYSLYNSVWSKLEQDCLDNAPESITHVKDIKRSTTQVPFDFILSGPEFKVYKKN